MKFSNFYFIYPFVFIYCYFYVGTSAQSAAEESTYTEDEKMALVKFREAVKDQLYQDYMHRDEYLINWLRTRKLNINQAKEMLLGALKWRKENKIDSLADEKFPQFQDGYKVDMQSRDKDGRPVLFIPVGTWDIRKAALSGEMPNVMRYTLKVFLEEPSKLAREVGQENGSNSTQFIFVHDAAGFNLRQQGCIACLPVYLNYIQAYERYYPQMHKEVIVVNMPGIFNTIVELTRPFWSEHLSQHSHFVGFDKNQVLEMLTKYIPLDQIPVQLGGTNTRRIS